MEGCFAKELMSSTLPKCQGHGRQTEAPSQTRRLCCQSKKVDKTNGEIWVSSVGWLTAVYQC